MEFTLYGIALVPAVMGLVDVAKKIGCPDKFAPLASIALGIGAGFLMSPADPAQAIVTGIGIGLAASGLYSGSKALAAR